MKYLPFIKKAAGQLAKKYGYSKDHDYEALLSQGVLGWLEAEAKYDTTKSNALFAYASKYAVGYMQRYVFRTNKWRRWNSSQYTVPIDTTSIINDDDVTVEGFRHEMLDSSTSPEQEAIRQEELHYIDVMCTIECPRNVDIIHKLCSGVKKKDLDCTLDISSNLVKRLRKYRIL